MTHLPTPVKATTTAPLTNVALFSDLMGRITDRPRHLPGLGVFYGFSGLGKTWSARYAANRHRAFYIEAGESWTRARLLKALLAELGRPPGGTVADMVDQAIEALVVSDRPVIIDEADHIVRRGAVELVREIHDKSGAAIALLGEELLPQAISRKSERTHNRVLVWTAAQLAGTDDVGTLAGLYYPHLDIEPALLEALAKASAGRIRRVAVNLEMLANTAAVEGWPAATLDRWGDRAWYTGQAPGRRTG